MKRYTLSAKLLSPLSIRQNRQSDMSTSMSFLTGNSLRGAMAAKYIRDGGAHADETFQKLFIDQPVHFPHLFPTNSPVETASPLSLTCVSCKRNPGFHGSGNHGVYDTLAHKLAFRHQLKLKQDLSCAVSTCASDMKTISGFWNGKPDSPEEMKSSQVFRRHTGIDRTTGTVAPSIFFMTQTMADLKKNPETETYVQQHLSGTLYMNEEQLADVKTICEGTLFVGSSRTRGNGEIQLTIGDEETPAHFPEIMNWDTDFKTKLKSCVDQEIPSHLLEGIYFSVKLESELIVVDRFLRPSFDLTFPLESIQPVLKITNSTVIRGWQSAWGLPKPDDIGLTMGSVFLFRYTGNDMDTLNQLLNENVVNGIGLRREEGYGRISLCDPLHIQKEAV